MKKKGNAFLDTVKKAARNVWLFLLAAARTVRRSMNPRPGPAVRKTLFYTSRFFGILIKIALSLIVIVVCTLGVVTVYGALYVTKGIETGPPVILEEYDSSLSTKFYAKPYADAPEDEYVLVATISGEENRLWATYEETPQYLKDAVVAIEDQHYWEHKGVDWKRTLGAFTNMFLYVRDNFGGSTITQQLIKNVTGNDEVTVQRKFQEIFDALELEQNYSKEYILENYMNVIFLGNMCYGFKTAAAEYFGKELSELTLLECACLAGITNNPYMYDPYINPKNNRRRTDIILGQMLKQNLITEEEYARAKSQTLSFNRKGQITETNVWSWFVDEAFVNVRDDLMKQYGWSNVELGNRLIFSGGLSVYLTQDLSIQEKLDSVWYNPDSWPKSKDEEVPEGTMMILDPYNGSIAGLIGSRAPKVANRLENRATQTYRQPGSSLKPLSVYAPAFELGLLTPYDSMLDAPLDFNVEKDRVWPLNQPEQYDGNMSILQAVAQSKNTIAAKIMRYLLTPEVSRNFVTDRFHLSKIVSTITANGLIDGESSMAHGALTLGASVKEMTAAFGVFPTGGTYCEPRTYTKVLDREGKVLMDNPPKRSVSISSMTAYYVNTVLKNAVQTGTGKAAKLGDMPVAGKTGTTNDNYDRWFCGYTSYYVGACWFGYAIPRDLGKINPNPALQMWTQVMTLVHEGLEPRDFDTPPGLVTAKYCLDSGKQPTVACERDPRGGRVQQGSYALEDVPTEMCDAHVNVDLCTISGHLARPDCPEATRKTVGLVQDHDRIMPGPGVKLPDEQYTYRQYNVSPYAIVDPETQFAPVRTGDYNTFCEVPHSVPKQPDPTPTEPDPPDPVQTEPPQSDIEPE